MDSVLLIGSVRPGRNADLHALLRSGLPGARVFCRGATVAFLFDGPGANARFLRTLNDPESILSLVADCLEELPLLPVEVAARAG